MNLYILPGIQLMDINTHQEKWKDKPYEDLLLMMMIRKSLGLAKVLINSFLTFLKLLNRNEFELARRAPAFHGETNVQR
jgi:hypothetical protein